MQGIGKILREEREKRDITMDMVADATKIRKKYLTAIEEEKFDVLPGEVYARGFVTAYLKYLGIKDREDVTAIMARKIQADVSNAQNVDSGSDVADKPVAIAKKQDNTGTDADKNQEESIIAPRVPFNAATTEQNLRSRKSRRNKKVSFEEVPITQKGTMIIVITLVAIALLLGIKWGYSKVNATVDETVDRNIPVVEEQQPEEPDVVEAANTPDATDIQETQSEQPAVAETTPKQTNELHMTIRVLDITPNQNDQCWMQITVDGTASEETLSQGQERQIVAKDSITLNLGNAGAVSLIVNGQDLGVQGSKGKVVKKTFYLSDFNG